MRSVTLTAWSTLSAFSSLSAPFFRVDLKDAVAGAEIRMFGDLVRIRTGLRFNQADPCKAEKIFIYSTTENELTIRDKRLRDATVVQLLR